MCWQRCPSIAKPRLHQLTLRRHHHRQGPLRLRPQPWSAARTPPTLEGATPLVIRFWLLLRHHQNERVCSQPRMPDHQRAGLGTAYAEPGTRVRLNGVKSDRVRFKNEAAPVDAMAAYSIQFAGSP